MAGREITIPEDWKQKTNGENSIFGPGNAMMDEHPWRAFCRHDSFREWRASLLSSSSFAENWTRFFVFFLHSFVPLHRRWIGGSSKQTACEIALDARPLGFLSIKKALLQSENLVTCIYIIRGNRLWFEMARGVK